MTILSPEQAEKLTKEEEDLLVNMENLINDFLRAKYCGEASINVPTGLKNIPQRVMGRVVLNCKKTWGAAEHYHDQDDNLCFNLKRKKEKK